MKNHLLGIGVFIAFAQPVVHFGCRKKRLPLLKHAAELHLQSIRIKTCHSGCVNEGWAIALCPSYRSSWEFDDFGLRKLENAISADQRSAEMAQMGVLCVAQDTHLAIKFMSV